MQPVLFETPDNPSPDPTGTRHIAGYFTTRDGKRLRYAIFKGEAPLARGTVVLLQGRNECIEKYYETIADLNARGLWVATFDWRGQGGSERLLKDHSAGYVRRFRDYEHDLEDFLEGIVLPDTRLPFFILAHSTGGLVALSAAPRLANRIERMVLTAPFVALAGERFGERALGWLARFLCLVGRGHTLLTRNRSIQPFEANRLTHDRARYARNQAIFSTAPVLAPSSPTARWLAESLAAMRRVRDPSHLAAIRVPTLILAAGADKIVPIRAIEELGSFFRAGRVVTIDRARHELLQESDTYREPTLAAIEAFIPGRPAEVWKERQKVGR